MKDVLTPICNKIWKTGEMADYMTQSLVITFPKKGNLQLYQKYRTISSINPPSIKGYVGDHLKRLVRQAEEIIAEEQAG